MPEFALASVGLHLTQFLVPVPIHILVPATPGQLEPITRYPSSHQNFFPLTSVLCLMVIQGEALSLRTQEVHWLLSLVNNICSKESGIKGHLNKLKFWRPELFISFFLLMKFLVSMCFLLLYLFLTFSIYKK